jgi:hypothetical protein
MDVVCDHALRQCEPEPEPVGVYIFTDQADLMLFALQFRGKLKMFDNAALVFPTDRDEVDAFIVDYDIYKRVQCVDLTGVWFWDSEDEITFTEQIEARTLSGSLTPSDPLPL